MKGKLKKIVVGVAIFVVIFILLHITPNVALRTHVFIMGDPKIAVTSTIESDFVHKDLETKNEKFYRVTPSPIDEPTGGMLTSYKVKKVGFLYLASYYGEA